MAATITELAISGKTGVNSSNPVSYRHQAIASRTISGTSMWVS